MTRKSPEKLNPRRQPKTPPTRRPSLIRGRLLPFLKTYFRQLQRYLVTGLLVWIPLIITLWVSWWFIYAVGSRIEGFIKRLVEHLNEFGGRVPSFHFLTEFRYSPGLGFLTAILIFLITGFLTRYLVGRKLIASGEYVVRKIPLISRVYTAVQQIRDVFINREGAVFQEVVLIEYPRPGLLVVGFVTSREQGVVQKSAGRQLTAVFVPTTPNPTSGFLLYVPPEELIPLSISVEEAMKLIVSGGAYLPGEGSGPKPARLDAKP